MVRNFTEKDILKWTDVVFGPDDKLIQEIASNWTSYKKIFIDKVAELLYEDLRRAVMQINTPLISDKKFSSLPEDEKAFWYDYASGIPKKLRSLNLFIRPFTDFCRTCIITDMEINNLAFSDHKNYLGKRVFKERVRIKTRKAERKTEPSSFQFLPEKRKWYFRELNYLIPVQLKKIGYEIIRPDEASEIDMIMIKKLARAIHSGYLREMRNSKSGEESVHYVSLFRYSGDYRNRYLTDFDDLPDEIKYSNKDNAYHIPTKLLSIGYKIRHLQKDFKPVTLHLSEAEIETMACVEHIRWSWDKRLNGWIYGKEKDTANKIHPALIPYEELAETEKEKDRELVRLIPALLNDIEYEVYPINPDRIRNLSYAIKPQSNLHKLLNETRKLNYEIRSLASTAPAIEKRLRDINNKIEENLSEVQGSYNYAQHIQKTFLPDNLYIRECFPDSFVLLKPKDIISGDFYFFSKQDHLIIFAAVDCTGHGIPGALLSTIGYGIADQAVNEIKLTSPPEILRHLYSKVHKFLRWDEDKTGLEDNMDTVLCTLDIRTNLLTYSGVKNPLYHVTNGDIKMHRAKNTIDDNDGNAEWHYSSEKIQLKPGDTIYLCSDGYTDQFGGRFHKKYLSNRFKSFLLSIQDYPMAEQNDKLYEEIEKWREQNDEEQTDDILVIGIRV